MKLRYLLALENTKQKRTLDKLDIRVQGEITNDIVSNF